MQKNKQKETILALRPGRREMGIAVLSGSELRYWGVTRFRQMELEELLSALERRIARLIYVYHPDMIAVEQPAPVRMKTSPWLERITEHIGKTAKRSSLRLRTFDPVRVRQRLCGYGCSNRHDLVKQIVTRYPHLSRYAAHTSRWKREYWMQMFAAVAVGMECAQHYQ